MGRELSRFFWFFIVSVCFFLVLQSCQTYEEPSVVGISQVKINEVNMERLSISASLVIHNPNNVSLDLSRTFLSIISDDLVLANVDQTHNIKMPRSSDFDLPLSIEVDTKELFEGDMLQALSFANKLISARSIEIMAKGYLYVGKDAVQLKVPIERKETIEF